MRLLIGGARFTNNTVYHDRIEEEDSLQPSALDTSNICRYRRDEMSPYITAVVGKKDLFIQLSAE